MTPEQRPDGKSIRNVSFRLQGLSLPKRGHSADEFEDAFAADPRTGRFAIADGASESSFASLWARLLVDGFVHPAGPPDAGAEWLAPLQKRWSAEVDGRPLPWYAEAKRQEGAFATFLGLVVRRSPGRGSGAWQVRAVGDSCLFQVRKDRLVKAFPLTRSADFGDRPALLGSRPAGDDPFGRQRRDQGRWQPGDRFFLMTDALAQWFLGQQEAGQHPWRSVEAVLRQPAAFADWVEKLREQGALRNDDVTLLGITFFERRTGLKTGRPAGPAAAPRGGPRPDNRP